MTDLKENVVLITGGSSGIGLALAKRMAAQESTVIICGRSQEKLENARRQEPKLVTIACDVTREEERSALFEHISERYPRFNMLVNNAAIAHRYLLGDTANLEPKIVAEWQTNFLAPVMLAEKFLPLLSRNNGTLVNISSGLAYIPLIIEPSYCASKAALHSMTMSMRLRYGKRGVKVTEVFFPAVDTPFQKGHAPANAIQPEEAAILALRGLDRGKEEIRIRLASLLYRVSRLMPKRALKLVNSMIPDDAAQILASER